MKKRLFAIVLALLFFSHVASAYVAISSAPKDKYNLGEAIAVSGYVSSEERMSGFLRTSIECGDLIYLSSLVPVAINAGAKLSFPSQIYVPSVIVSSSMYGLCHANVGLVEDGIENDYAVSKDFEVTKELKASFRIREKNLQAGVPLELAGAIARIDGKPITGIAEIYNVLGGARYLVSVADVVNGNFSFTYQTKSLPAGTYTVEVAARDMYGNEETFEAASYIVSNQLELTAKLDKNNYLPGDEIIIQGELRNVLNALVKTATGYISFGGVESAVKVAGGKLEHRIKLPSNAKSGKHTISISASDELGNSGAASISFFVVPVPTMLKVEMENAEAMPMQSVMLYPKLLDQANDLIDAEIDLQIDDAKGDAVVAGQYESGKKIDYAVQQHAPPGEWEVKARYAELSAKSLFHVSEVKDIRIDVSGTRVLFTNTGNVKWKDDAGLKLEGGPGAFSSKMTSNIRPGETFAVDLGKQAPTGSYTLEVALPDRTETFENFQITDGKKVFNINIVYIVMLLLVVGLIAYELTLLLKKSTRLTPKLDNDDLRRFARKAKPLFDARQAEELEKRKLVEDYKRMTLDEIKRTEEKMRPAYPDRPWRRRAERKPAEKKEEGNAGGAANFFSGF